MDFDETDCVISIFHESFMKAKHFLKICLPFRWNCEVQAPAEACEEARGAGAQVGGPPGKGEVRQGRQGRPARPGLRSGSLRSLPIAGYSDP